MLLNPVIEFSIAMGPLLSMPWIPGFFKWKIDSIIQNVNTFKMLLIISIIK